MPTCHEGENVSLARTSTDREGEPREHQERLVREVEKRQDGKTHIAEQKQIREEQERQVKINATHPKKEQRIFKRSNQQSNLKVIVWLKNKENEENLKLEDMQLQIG
ncbi:Protein CBG27824 [Caenorhabditis briggsae]|uniref:Protein CBG27824 n=1 Tax=Caenorhabditis briggsae TaxID=6238 RepID=B6IKA6_CAEBR|nr:Protein CBG27824 [Caenorhabditis briggsae]CAS00336.1 Protein CBG27824 [Caenorhabditis briggsae]